MIQVIYVGNQRWPEDWKEKEFAIYNTIPDKFVNWDFYNIFTSVEEFIEAWDSVPHPDPPCDRTLDHMLEMIRSQDVYEKESDRPEWKEENSLKHPADRPVIT